MSNNDVVVLLDGHIDLPWGWIGSNLQAHARKNRYMIAAVEAAPQRSTCLPVPHIHTCPAHVLVRALFVNE